MKLGDSVSYRACTKEIVESTYTEDYGKDFAVIEVKDGSRVEEIVIHKNDLREHKT